MSRRLKIGLALGSGGARGFCHIGVLRGLAEIGIRPDVIAGCSMGALVGAAYAGGRLDALELWARAITRRSFLSLVDLRFSGGGLVEAREIMTLIERLGLPKRIEELEHPFAAVATDLETGREVWLRDGPLDLAVRASAAMPGVISPLYHQGKWLLDGGMVNPVPVSLARAMGADVVIAVNPNARLDGTLWQAPEVRRPSAGLTAFQARLPEAFRGLWPTLPTPDMPPAPGYLDVLSTSIDIMTDHIRRARMAGEPPQVLLSAELSEMTVLDFHEAKKAITDGFRMVRDHETLLRRVCSVG
ncbi:patatin-like phospholipase family protein [Celeribacter persicus]|uniref:NTE family protein n=1 Tax=Celeribacter persicus TaxID=1651082 RepID=A0A2T5HSK1_9RHOB|nr:patatin-like phospholipase family protein [Celeribacter persicus]PTQ74565.1 NTE family protein [Celeribacter persicus]